MTITIEHVQAEQAKLAALIERFTAQSASVTTHIVLAGADIELRDGERYAGATLDGNGNIKHHLVLLAARPDSDVNWSAAMAWALSVGGSLPDRQEQALLFANCKDVLPERWCWSSEASGSSYAWHCSFYDGYQGSSGSSYDVFAVAVRRLNP